MVVYSSSVRLQAKNCEFRSPPESDLSYIYPPDKNRNCSVLDYIRYWGKFDDMYNV